MMKNARLAIVLIFGFVGATQANEDAWVAKADFLIEDSNQIETLIFISGMSYALTASNEALEKQNKPNFICLPDSRIIGSKLLIDILNYKLSGRVPSETVVSTAMEGLSERFPCQ